MFEFLCFPVVCSGQVTTTRFESPFAACHLARVNTACFISHGCLMSNISALLLLTMGGTRIVLKAGERYQIQEVANTSGRIRIHSVSIVFHVQSIELCNSSSCDLFHPPWANDTAASYMNWTKIGYVTCSNESTVD